MTQSTPPIVEAREVGRRAQVDGRWLLRNVSLGIYPGDRLGIIGPTGAGKTLLLRALALLDPLEEGEVVCKGNGVWGNSVPRYRSQVVYLHQRPTLTEGTVLENLRLPLSFKCHRDQPFDRDRIVGWLDALGRNESFLEKQLNDLSGGESQLAALLRAAQLMPRVLLLDEPTAALDRQSAGFLERFVENWLNEEPHRRAYVWVSHDPEQARRMTSRIVRMNSGHIEV